MCCAIKLSDSYSQELSNISAIVFEYQHSLESVANTDPRADC